MLVLGVIVGNRCGASAVVGSAIAPVTAPAREGICESAGVGVAVGTGVGGVDT